jgi:beta-lactamase regulating signal transducer with metallopeptidase domain
MLPLLQSILIEQVLPSIFDAATSLLFVSMLSKIFKIKSPHVLFALYFAMLMRSFIILIDNYCTCIAPSGKTHPVMIGLRIVDPFNILSFSDVGAATLQYRNDAVLIALIVACVFVLLFLFLRWAQLLMFLVNLKREAVLDREQHSWLYSIVENISKKARINPPRIVQSDRFPMVPFTIGINRPTVIISEELIDKFSRDKLEVMLAHEVAHIKRADYVNNWFTLILRDLMFFNPFTSLLYRKAEEEKEKICDRTVLRLIDTTPEKIANVLVDIALFYKTEQLKTINAIPSMAKGFLYDKTTLEKRIASILSAPSPKEASRFNSLLRLLGLFITFLIVCFFQFSLLIKVNSIWINLR